MLAAGLAGGPAATAANPTKDQYAVTDIGNLNDPPCSSLCPQGSGAYGMNNHGDVVGWSYYTWDGSVYAVLYVYADGALQSLGTLGGWSSYGYAINDRGVVVGTAAVQPSYRPNYPFSWENGVTSNLFAGFPSCDMSNSLNLNNCRGIGFDINSQNQIVGARYLTDFTVPNAAVIDGAFLYSGGTFTDLGSLPGDTGSTATAINDRGDIVGTSGPSWTFMNCCGGDLVTREGGGRAFLYRAGVMHDLGTLGGPLSGANDISNNGKIVGFSDTGSGERHAFMTTKGGVMHDLGTLGGSFSEATAVNRNGTVIVGNSTTASGDLHGFVYAKGKMVDLSDRVPAGSGAVVDAQDVNDSGQIAGRMTFPGRAGAFAVLLTPTDRGKG